MASTSSYETPVALNLTNADLTFDDEFNTFTSSADGSVGWMTEFPWYGSERSLADVGAASYFSDSSVGADPFSDSNGILDITATVAAPGSDTDGVPYVSGAMTTYTSFAQLYGYFAISAELPAGQGLWPAFWMLPVDGQAGELDVFEVLGNSPTTLYATTHSGVAGEGISQAITVANTSTSFNTYAVDWTPTTITFYFDNQVIATAPTPSDMHVPMYMLVDLAVGGAGSWAGAPTSNAEFPATMQVDWVRAYATADTVDVSGSAAIVADPSSITGTVLFSATGDQGVAGVPLPGATVFVLDASGTVVGDTTTDASGTFTFSGLSAGDYTLQYTTASGYALLAGGAANPTTGLSGTIVATGGSPTVAPTETYTASGVAGTVEGTVLMQAGSGSATATAGVTVTLETAAGQAIGTDVTDAAGAYAFGGVGPGTYLIAIAAPAGDAFAAGGPANAATGDTATFSLAAGATVTLAAETLTVAPATLTGSVLLGGVAEAGVWVTLLSSLGATLGVTTTGANGAFSFAGLAPGTYQLWYSLPAGTTLLSGPAGTTGLTGALTLAAGQTLTVAAEALAPIPATLTGAVLFAGVGQSGVTVTLLNAANAMVTTATTDGNGDFTFTGLAAGSYALAYTAPPGGVFQTGDPANTATGVTGLMTVAAGQTVTAPTEHLLVSIATLTMNGKGAVLDPGGGTFIVTGNPQGGSLTLGDGNQTVSLGGNSTAITLGDGNDTVTLSGTQQSLRAGNGTETIAVAGKSATVDFGTTPAGTTSTVVISGVRETVTGGGGNVTVTGQSGTAEAVVTLGNGNDTVNLVGTDNSVTVGNGASVIDAGTSDAVVTTGTGNATVMVAGTKNVIDVGAGNNVIDAAGSTDDTFEPNGVGQGLTTINGFSMGVGDVFDLARTLAGATGIKASLSNISSYITSSVSNGNTTLYADPTPGSGTPYAFATLSHVSTTVAQLLSGHDFSMT